MSSWRDGCDCGDCQDAEALRAQLAAVTKERNELREKRDLELFSFAQVLRGDASQLRADRDAVEKDLDAMRADLAREREQAQSLARQLLVEQERGARLEAAMEAAYAVLDAPDGHADWATLWAAMEGAMDIIESMGAGLGAKEGG